MFKQLQTRMLLLNLSVLTILLIAVFGTLYGILYSSVSNRIDDELDKILYFNDFYNDDISPVPPSQDPFRFDRTISFLILVDNNGDILDSASQFPTEITFLEEAVVLADSTSGRMELDDYKWAYQTREVPEGVLIAYTDITTEMATLQAALIRFSAIFVVSMIVISAISIFFTRRSIRPIKESFEKQQQFIADASHELKTPLTVINTNLDVLQTAGKDKDKWIGYIKSEVERMNLLTHKLLYLASISEIEKDDVPMSVFNSTETIESILLGLEALAYEKGITLEYHLMEQLDIKFNPEQFQQIILILVENALKYTNPNGKVTIQTSVKSSHVYIDITNTGRGISEEDQKHIFDRFYKGDKSREHKDNSFGLGLAIAKTIIENHSGSIHVKSETDRFTTFQIRLKRV